jgi:hypothetical protein
MCKAWVAQLVSYKEGGKILIANLDPINVSFFVSFSAVLKRGKIISKIPNVKAMCLILLRTPP